MGRYSKRGIGRTVVKLVLFRSRVCVAWANCCARGIEAPYEIHHRLTNSPFFGIGPSQTALQFRKVSYNQSKNGICPCSSAPTCKKALNKCNTIRSCAKSSTMAIPLSKLPKKQMYSMKRPAQSGFQMARSSTCRP